LHFSFQQELHMVKSRVRELFDKTIHWLRDYSTMNNTGRTDE